MIPGMNSIRSTVTPPAVAKMEKQDGIAPNLAAAKLLAAKSGTANSANSAVMATADQLNLSPTALKTLAFLNNQTIENDDDLGDLGNFGNIQSLKQKGEMLSAILQMKMQSFDGKLLGKMQAAGVDTSQEMRLQDLGTLGILETSGHPDATKIKQLFEQESSRQNGSGGGIHSGIHGGFSDDLVSGFREISQLAELIRGLEQLPQDVTAGTMSLSTIAAKYARQSLQPSSQSSPFVHTIGGGGY